MSTGEPIPVPKNEADTRCPRDGKRNGALVYRAHPCGLRLRPCRKSFRMVGRMLPSAKLPVQRIWSIRSPYVVLPAVHGDCGSDLSLIWLTVGRSPIVGVSRFGGQVPVLIMACPLCVAAGNGRPHHGPALGRGWSELGVLFRKGNALHTLAEWCQSRSTRQGRVCPDAPGGDRSGRPQRLIPVRCLASCRPLSGQVSEAPNRTAIIRMREARRGCPLAPGHIP